jgi:hypothetical protein
MTWLMTKRASPWSIALALFVVGICLAPDISVAQTTDRPEIQEDFRKRVVRSWRWKPKSGIGLTTTEYARDYLLSHYFNSSGEWKGESPALSRKSILKTPLVLFQSKGLDIIVLPRGQTQASDYGVIVLRRDSAEIVERDDTACSSFDSRWEFMNADGAKPLELMQVVENGGCASQLTVEAFRLYDATEGNLLLRQKEVADYGGRCPKFMSHILEPIPHGRTRDSSGYLTFEFRVWFRIFQKHETGYCAVESVMLCNSRQS